MNASPCNNKIDTTFVFESKSLLESAQKHSRNIFAASIKTFSDYLSNFMNVSVLV